VFLIQRHQERAYLFDLLSGAGVEKDPGAVEKKAYRRTHSRAAHVFHILPLFYDLLARQLAAKEMAAEDPVT
jgi:hypothetical protein